jgi:uncharacterized surface protein with fasciclin (FAS1) repeats
MARDLGKILDMRLHSWPTCGIRFAIIASILVLASVACGRTSTTIVAKPTGGAGPVNLRPSRTVRPSASARPTTPARPGTSARPSAPALPAAALVGADCALIPAKGRGSLGSVSTQKAITAASGNRRLSAFVAAVRSARLERTLNSRHSYTLVIPDNSAFAALAKTQVIRLRESGELLRIVKYHAVPAMISPQQFTTGATPKTLQGMSLRLSKAGSAYKVNGAVVLCGNIRTSNATVYIVNKVLLPPR